MEACLPLAPGDCQARQIPAEAVETILLGCASLRHAIKKPRVELLPFAGSVPGAIQNRPADSDLSQARTPPARRTPQRSVCQRKTVCPPACGAERSELQRRPTWAGTSDGG